MARSRRLLKEMDQKKENNTLWNMNKISTNTTSAGSYSTTRAILKNVSVFDVAAYILQKCGEISTMRLQKLVYYAQAWALVWDDGPLFSEEIEAWANGPVVRELFNYHQGMFSIRSIEGNPEKIPDWGKETIDVVLKDYEKLTTQQLSDMTHDEKPWQEARKGLSSGERGNRIITKASMAEYYSSLS